MIPFNAQLFLSCSRTACRCTVVTDFANGDYAIFATWRKMSLFLRQMETSKSLQHRNLTSS